MVQTRFLFLLILFQQLVSAQANQQDQIQERYREDQFYLGFSYVGLLSDQEDFNQNGLSSDFQFGFIRDMPLVPSGRLAFGIGLGYGQQQFNSNLLRLTDSNSNSLYVFQNLEDQVEKMKYSFKSIVFPLSIRWRNSSATNFKFWRIYGGVKFRYTFASYASNNREKINIKNDVLPWTTEGFISFGYNTWNVYLGYEFRSIFDKNIQDNASETVD